MKRPPSLVILVVLGLAACAGGPPKAPYPAFVETGLLPDVFLASLPGVRAKQLAGDPQTRRTSNRVDLPPAWEGTSGGTPGRSLEIFVLEGALTLADIELPRGGYAFLPAGSLGFNLKSEDGARILYVVSDADPDAMIRSPIIIDSGLLPWEPTATPGVAMRELRKDPGSGARTWLLRVATGATQPWRKAAVVREGYLLAGNYRQSECVLGKVLTGDYAPGGYFYRPAEAVSGGPETVAVTESVWFLRETASGVEETLASCAP